MIVPATLTQVREGRDGRMIEIGPDVLEIGRQLREIDPSLGLDWNDRAEYFRVYQLVDEADRPPKRHTVLTALELTPEIVERVRYLAHPDYEYSKEIERKHDQADRNKDHEFHERTGEGGERLHHALRKDMSFKPRIFVPRWP